MQPLPPPLPPHLLLPLRQLLWCLCAALATGISSNPYVISTRLSWSNFFDVAALNDAAQSLPLILEFLSVPLSPDFDCSQVKDDAALPPSFRLSNRLASLLAIEMPVIIILICPLPPPPPPHNPNHKPPAK